MAICCFCFQLFGALADWLVTNLILALFVDLVHIVHFPFKQGLKDCYNQPFVVLKYAF